MNFHASWLTPLIGSAILLVAAGVASVVVQFVLSRVVFPLAARSANRFVRALFEFGTAKWLIRVVPIVVVKLGIGMVPGVSASIAQTVDRICFAIVVLFVSLTVSAVLSALEQTYRITAQDPRLASIKGPIQVAKLALFATAALVVIGKETGQEIGLILSGLGAMSAVLILIFRDTLLGFVAGVQISTNDMLRIGDWITMPSAGADGTVLDISLNTVKVSNFDNTIITIPTWKMITESYQNWRGMSESGGRRIKRAIFIDATSVQFLNLAEIARLERLTLLQSYLSEKRAELVEFNKSLGEAAESAPNRRQLTNLGTFRVYVASYLNWNPHIRRDMPCMARQLQSSAEGIPIELYCFTDTTNWVEYETIQADLFDHLIAVLPEFGLRIYQYPSGFDARSAFFSISRNQ
jgi:miniconductance mechanosensitive channel